MTKIGEYSMTIEFANRTNYKAIKHLYLDAFPNHERMPFFMLKSAVKKGKAEILIAKERGEVIAFAYLVLYRDMVYLFYFAVLSELRNKGIGSILVKYLIDHYQNKRIFLAVEQPNEKVADNELRIKRKAFYLKNGFSNHKYKLQEKNVIFDVMAVGGEISIEEYKKMFRFWGGRAFNIFMKITITE